MKSYEQTITNILLGKSSLAESHFKVGDEVKIKETGDEGEVVKLDEPQVGKYYTVKHEDGSMKKYSSDELELEDEEDKEGEDQMKEASGASKSQETKFHKQLDTLVHKTFGKRPEEMKEEFEDLDEATTAEIQKALSSTPKGLTIHMKHKDSGETKSTTFMGTHSAVAAAKSHINSMKKKGYEFQKHELVEAEMKKDDKAPFEPSKPSKPVTPGKYGQDVSKVKHLARQAMPKMQKEEIEDEVDQTIIEHNTFDIEIPQTLRYGDYLTAAKKLVGEEEAIVVANHFFKEQDESLVIESFTRADIEDKVKAHQKAGHEVSMPKYSTKEGKPYAEYTVTNKETKKKTKYIHHGSTRRVVT